MVSPLCMPSAEEMRDSGAVEEFAFLFGYAAFKYGVWNLGLVARARPRGGNNGAEQAGRVSRRPHSAHRSAGRRLRFVTAAVRQT